MALSKNDPLSRIRARDLSTKITRVALISHVFENREFDVEEKCIIGVRHCGGDGLVLDCRKTVAYQLSRGIKIRELIMRTKVI